MSNILEECVQNSMQMFDINFVEYVDIKRVIK